MNRTVASEVLRDIYSCKVHGGVWKNVIIRLFRNKLIFASQLLSS